ncbi:MAG: DUF169 domain-containing protein [Spirochaetes bacterium]|nr:DUF169 domain-containing protein [Spirochaetota bacterium]
MISIKEFNEYGEFIESSLALKSSALAIKMLKVGEEIPEHTLRPKRDRGYHFAQCQAFSLSRYQDKTIAMLKEDNWCWGALFAYGLIKPEAAKDFPELQNDLRIIPMLEYGKYTGILSAPLKACTFEPDIIMIYSDAAQLRHMLHVLSFIGEGTVTTPIYPVASCALSVVPALNGQTCITLPDPGEVGRGFAKDDEIIFSLPAGKISKLAGQLKAFDDMKMGHKHGAFIELRADFARPDFYKRLFRECGLDAEDTLKWPE